jgi:predicted transcriptional regulator
MKVFRKEEDFKPVTIIIESQDEFDYLWHCLNVPKRVIKNHSATEYAFPNVLDKSELFNALDEIDRPRLA